MNLSILPSYRTDKSQTFNKSKISRVLLELAEIHLNSPESSDLISRKGIEKLRNKVNKL